LALYAFTGGVPKYIELFCDNGMLNAEKMIEFMIRENSSFTALGNKSIGGQLKRLVEDYNIIFRQRPLMAKACCQNMILKQFVSH